MAANVRGHSVEKYEDGKWRWRIRGNLWQFVLSEQRRIFRNGVEVAEYNTRTRMLCVDDAVLYAMGWEEGLLCTTQDGPGGAA